MIGRKECVEEHAQFDRQQRSSGKPVLLFHTSAIDPQTRVGSCVRLVALISSVRTVRTFSHHLSSKKDNRNFPIQ